MFGSTKWSLGKHDWRAIGKAAGYSALSGVVAFISLQLSHMNFPPEYAAVLALLMPAINSLLLAVKRFCEDRSTIIEENPQG